MSHQNLSKAIFDRLNQQYGSFLTLDELACELRVTPKALRNRRSRGQTGNLPNPVQDILPLKYRAAEIARWLSGESELADQQSGFPEKRRGPGRPRKVAGGGTLRAGLNGVRP